MGRLRRIGLVLLVVAVVAVAWEPTRVGLQTAVLLPNLLGAGLKPLSLFSEAPQRSAVEYRPGTDGGAPELAELWLPSWASPDRKAGAILLVLGVNNVGRNQPVVARVADASGAHRRCRAGSRLARPAGGPARGRRDRRRRARVRAARRPPGGGSAAGRDRRLQRRRIARPAGGRRPADRRAGAVRERLRGLRRRLDVPRLRFRARLPRRSRHGSAVDAVALAREVYLRFMLDQVADAGDRARSRSPRRRVSSPPRGRRPTRSCARRSRPTPHERSTTC